MDQNTRKFIELNPAFKERKFTLNQFFKTQESIGKIVSTDIRDIIFHRIGKTKKIYQGILCFDMGDIIWLGKAISKRYDCAYHAGHNKGGQ